MVGLPKSLCDNISFSFSVWLQFSQTYGGSFLYFVIWAVKSISQKNGQQLFFFTLAMSARGLSDTCLDLFGKAELVTQKNTFYRKRQALIDQEEAENMRMIKESNAIVWVDNFSKFYGRQWLATGVGQFRTCLFTVFGVRYMDPLVGRLLDRQPNQGSPTHLNILDPALFDAVLLEVKRVILKLNTNCRRFANSASLANTTINVTFRRNPGDTDVGGLREFHGVSIEDYNIGADEGLADTCITLAGMVNKDRVTAVKMDINIYLRLLKVEPHHHQ